MTIAACHLSPEGIILGTDSTSTIIRTTPNGVREHYHDYEQKMFEVGGSPSTVAVATWGLGRMGNVSHRTIAARLGVKHKRSPFTSVRAMADHLAKEIIDAINGFSRAEFMRGVDLCKKYMAEPSSVTRDEWIEIQDGLARFSGGYFLGGRINDAEACEAFEIKWSIIQGEAAAVEPLNYEQPYFRGVPQIMQRLVLGYDEDLANHVLNSGKWNGSAAELVSVLSNSNFRVEPGLLPLRDAIDWIHTVIHTTIRANKFSGWHTCGGPVEIAVVTTDRPFRWICHKGLDAAIITAQEGLKR